MEDIGKTVIWGGGGECSLDRKNALSKDYF